MIASILSLTTKTILKFKTYAHLFIYPDTQLLGLWGRIPCHING